MIRSYMVILYKSCLILSTAGCYHRLSPTLFCDIFLPDFCKDSAASSISFYIVIG